MGVQSMVLQNCFAFFRFSFDGFGKWTNIKWTNERIFFHTLSQTHTSTRLHEYHNTAYKWFFFLHFNNIKWTWKQLNIFFELKGERKRSNIVSALDNRTRTTIRSQTRCKCERSYRFGKIPNDMSLNTIKNCVAHTFHIWMTTYSEWSHININCWLYCDVWDFVWMCMPALLAKLYCM